MYRDFPKAILAAREDEALTHGQVLYGLVKPTKKLDQVESTAAMVNVIPRKRIYRMESPEEIDLFMSELMKRPLVLQPSAFIGRGLAVVKCAVYTKEERWILLINQTHPKIHGQLQRGIESAKMKMSRGEPFVLEISLNSYLKHVYLSSLTKAVLDKRFTFVDFEGADIAIRYPGDHAHRGIQWEIKASNKIRLEFEDMLPGEIGRRTVSAAEREWSSPALRVIMPDELSDLLPGWTFEMIDPLEGVIPPEEGEEEVEEVEGATGDYDVSPEEVDLAAPPPNYNKVTGRAGLKAKIPSGVKLEIPVELHAAKEVETPLPNYNKVVGRAKRKEMQTGRNVEVPLELHAPVAERPANMYHPVSPSGRGLSPSPNRPYEKSNRTEKSEKPYDMLGQRRLPRSPGQQADVPYEPMNVSGSAHTPTTPQSLRPSISPRSPVSPTGKEYAAELDSHRARKQTYLTDDDDSGFSRHVLRSPSTPSGNSYLGAHDGGMSPHIPAPMQSPGYKYDSKLNQTGHDRYNENYNPSDKYASPQYGGQGVTRQGYPSDRGVPVPAPRVFHRHQGSGRSDTSASDSGFGENENGHDSHSSFYGAGYSNQAYQDDSPDHQGNRGMVSDIMAKHKVMAAQMLHQSGSGGSNSHRSQNYYSDSPYNKELQKWRQNINDLEESCDAPNVNYSRSRLESDSTEDRMEESFI